MVAWQCRSTMHLSAVWLPDSFRNGLSCRYALSHLSRETTASSGSATPCFFACKAARTMPSRSQRNCAGSLTLPRHCCWPFRRRFHLGSLPQCFPWNGSVYGWLEGEAASSGSVANLIEFATSLGRFLCALQRSDAADGPVPGPHKLHRGGAPGVDDGQTRKAIVAPRGTIEGAT